MNKFLIMFGVLAAVVLFGSFIGTDPLPVVQKRGHDGQCVRVLVVFEGRETVRSCSVINLDTDRYDTEYVYGTPAEAADFQKDMAEQQVLQRLAHR